MSLAPARANGHALAASQIGHFGRCAIRAAADAQLATLATRGKVPRQPCGQEETSSARMAKGGGLTARPAAGEAAAQWVLMGLGPSWAGSAAAARPALGPQAPLARQASRRASSREPQRARQAADRERDQVATWRREAAASWARDLMAAMHWMRVYAGPPPGPWARGPSRPAWSMGTASPSSNLAGPGNRQNLRMDKRMMPNTSRVPRATRRRGPGGPTRSRTMTCTLRMTSKLKTRTMKKLMAAVPTLRSCDPGSSRSLAQCAIWSVGLEATWRTPLDLPSMPPAMRRRKRGGRRKAPPPSPPVWGGRRRSWTRRGQRSPRRGWPSTKSMTGPTNNGQRWCGERKTRSTGIAGGNSSWICCTGRLVRRPMERQPPPLVPMATALQSLRAHQ